MVNDAIPYWEVKEIINEIEEARTKALAAFQYSGGARIGELLRYTHTDKTITLGLLRSNIWEEGDFLFFKIPNFKNVKKTTKIGIVLIKEEPWLYKPIKFWLEHRKTEQVFDIKERMARLLLSKVLRGYSSHALRHSRATHLADLGMDGYEIQELLGHGLLQTSLTYVHKSTYQIAYKLQDKLRKMQN